MANDQDLTYRKSALLFEMPDAQETPFGSQVDLKIVYDVIVVGSGAAGGMAAYVLAKSGLKVLLLEAGKKEETDAELRSTEWPFENERRGDMPTSHHGLAVDEYTLRPLPYAKNSPYQKVQSYLQSTPYSDYRKNLLVDEKDHPYTGKPYAWVRSRLLGGKTHLWGRVALRMSDFDFRGKDHDGYGENWPLSYKDVAPYYDRVDRLLGIGGVKENLAQLPDSLYQRGYKLNGAELKMRERLAPSGRLVTTYRVGVATDVLPHNKYRARCMGRGACFRKGGCDIHAAFDSPTGLIYPAVDTGNVKVRTGAIAREITIDKDTGRARGIWFVDADTNKSYEARARVVVLAASTLESTRLMLLSKSKQHPNGAGNTSSHVGHNFCEHIMGPSVVGFMKDLVAKPRTADDARPGGFYIPRFENIETKNPKFLRGYGFQGRSGAEMLPMSVARVPGYGKAYKKTVRERAGAFVRMGGFGEVLARYENHVKLDPVVKDKWGVPALQFHIEWGDNEKKMVEDMADKAKEIFETSRIEIVDHSNKALPPGWSIHELGTARMGKDPKISVLNQFQQTHDIKNLFVVDGSSHVNSSFVNPTWTIMALAWRSCDYLVGEMKRGNI